MRASPSVALAERKADQTITVKLTGGMMSYDWRFDNKVFVCTFALCSIPDCGQALADMIRVVRPRGLLLIADHLISPNPLAAAGQWLAERFSIAMLGEHKRRRPLLLAQAAGPTIIGQERLPRGNVERFSAAAPDRGKPRGIRAAAL